MCGTKDKGWAYEVTRFLCGGQLSKRRVVQTKQIWDLVFKQIHIVMQLWVVKGLTTCLYWLCTQLEVNAISFDLHVKQASRYKAVILFMKTTLSENGLVCNMIMGRTEQAKCEKAWRLEFNLSLELVQLCQSDAGGQWAVWGRLYFCFALFLFCPVLKKMLWTLGLCQARDFHKHY